MSNRSPLNDPSNIYPPLQLDSLTLEKRRAFLSGLNASSGSPAAAALADVITEQATRAADEAADVIAEQAIQLGPTSPGREPTQLREPCGVPGLGQ